MRQLHHRLIGAGFAAFRMTGLHKALAPVTRGRGAILALHRVRPAVTGTFAPNRGLEITPAYLDAVLDHLRRSAYAIVPLDDVPRRLVQGGGERFVALTFDDGYRDTLEHALPVLERHGAPFTVFVTTGFATRTARLWWLELERALAGTEAVKLPIDGATVAMRTAQLGEKRHAFDRLARHLRQAPPETVTAALAALGCSPAAGRTCVETLCLDWQGLARLAAHPLVTIGCHTLTHPCLATLSPAALRDELAQARTIIAERIGRDATHLAYPYGGPTAAGAREFTAAADLGFDTAVTTRPGVLQPGHAARLTALPRISLNGLWPRLDALDILLSGAPFALRSIRSNP